MEKDIKLKPKKKNLIDKIKTLFEDKKKRYLYMFLFILPFLIAIGIFGYISYKEAINLIDLAKGTTEVKQEYYIDNMNYSLRNNATDIQKEYFLELKQAIEGDEATDENIAGLVCKNFITDFFTWSNKQGQYDVGGLCYVYDNEKTKDNLYLQARDGFYKYLSNYIKEYGVSNLLEVENVEVLSSTKLSYPYICTVNTHFYDDETGHYYEDVDYTYDEAYEVTCSWNYKLSEKFDTSKYVKKMNFIVVNNNGRFEIVESSENKIDARRVEEQ